MWNGHWPYGSGFWLLTTTVVEIVGLRDCVDPGFRLPRTAVVGGVDSLPRTAIVEVVQDCVDLLIVEHVYIGNTKTEPSCTFELPDQSRDLEKSQWLPIREHDREQEKQLVGKLWLSFSASTSLLWFHGVQKRMQTCTHFNNYLLLTPPNCSCTYYACIM